MTESESTQAALLEMARSIGGLESTVKTMVATWQAQELSASQGRRDLHQKVDALRADLHLHQSDLQSMGGQIAGALRDIADMRLTVDAVRAAKLKASGALTAGRWFYWLVFGSGGGAAALWIASHFFKVSLQ